MLSRSWTFVVGILVRAGIELALSSSELRGRPEDASSELSITAPSTLTTHTTPTSPAPIQALGQPSSRQLSSSTVRILVPRRLARPSLPRSRSLLPLLSRRHVRSRVIPSTGADSQSPKGQGRLCVVGSRHVVRPSETRGCRRTPGVEAKSDRADRPTCRIRSPSRVRRSRVCRYANSLRRAIMADVKTMGECTGS